MKTITIKHRNKMSNIPKQNAIDVSLEEEQTGLTNSYGCLDDFLKKMNE